MFWHLIEPRKITAGTIVEIMLMNLFCHDIYRVKYTKVHAGTTKICCREDMTGTQHTGERIVAGLDLGGTKLAAAVFAADARGESVSFVSSLENIKYHAMLDDEAQRGLTAEGRSKLIERAMVGAVRELLKEAGAECVDAVGVASAGFVEDGRVIEALNTGMKNYPLKERLEKELKTQVFLYKDSWTPIYALPPGNGDSIVFSLGTGFGGVSSRGGGRVSLRSRTARNKPVWIPNLAMNDDPGFAATFSSADLHTLLLLGIERYEDSGAEKPGAEIREILDTLPGAIRQHARDKKKMSPGKLEMFMARALAPRAASRIRSDQVFADLTGAADFPAFLYEKFTGLEIMPQELDRRLGGGDSVAALCFFIQAEFIGRVLALMQKERLENGLPPATRIYGTGSGYNAVTSKILGPALCAALSDHARVMKIGLAPDALPRNAELLVCSQGATTLPCLGAALGASRGIVQN